MNLCSENFTIVGMGQFTIDANRLGGGRLEKSWQQSTKHSGGGRGLVKAKVNRTNKTWGGGNTRKN